MKDLMKMELMDADIDILKKDPLKNKKVTNILTPAEGDKPDQKALLKKQKKTSDI